MGYCSVRAIKGLLIALQSLGQVKNDELLINVAFKSSENICHISIPVRLGLLSWFLLVRLVFLSGVTQSLGDSEKSPLQYQYMLKPTRTIRLCVHLSSKCNEPEIQPHRSNFTLGPVYSIGVNSQVVSSHPTTPQLVRHFHGARSTYPFPGEVDGQPESENDPNVPHYSAPLVRTRNAKRFTLLRLLLSLSSSLQLLSLVVGSRRIRVAYSCLFSLSFFFLLPLRFSPSVQKHT